MSYERDSYVEILRGSSWRAAQVVDTDDHEQEISVRYLDTKDEEWICYGSVSVRKISKPETVEEPKPVKVAKEKTPPLSPIPPVEEIKPKSTPVVVVETPKKDLPLETPSIQSKYKVGDGVLAAWSKSKSYTARVEAVLPNQEYRVQFEDGMKKIVSEDQMSKEADIIPDPSQPKYTTRHKSVDYITLHNAPNEPVTHKKKKKKRDKIKIKFSFSAEPKASNEAKNEIVTQAEVHHDPDVEVSPAIAERTKARVDITKSFLIQRKDGSIQWSTPIIDPKLPPGWHKHKALINNRFQAIILNSANKKFYSKSKLMRYLEAHNLEYPASSFDFAVTDTQKKRPSIDHKVEKKIKVQPQSTPPPPPPPPSLPAPPVPNWNLNFNPISGNYICPAEDCKKELRNENRLMMHLKHYHDEFKEMLPPKLNVADLAYARTNSLDDQEDPNEVFKPVRKSIDHHQGHAITGMSNLAISKQTASPVAKLPKAQVDISHTKQEIKAPEIQIEIEAPEIQSEIKAPEIPPPAADNITKDEDKIEVDIEPMDIDFESQIALFEITKKTEDPKKKSLSTSSSKKHKEVAAPVKPEVATPEKTEPVVNVTSPSPEKYEKMKKEEVVNCVCGLIEEDGLMIQCDVCLCWQHFHCSNYQNEEDVPEKYVCKICKNPPHLRKSQKYAYDHDWLHKGTLPTLDPDNKHIDEGFLRTQEILKETHAITGTLCNLSSAMHNASIKMQIAREPNHPKLYLWSPCVETETDAPQENPQGPKIPVPEAPIDTKDCRLNLLQQVEQDYDLMEERLNALEVQIADAEAECSGLMGNPANDIPTLQMLIKDLETLRTLAIVN